MDKRATRVLEFEAAYVRPKAGRTLVVGSHIYKSRPDRRRLYAEAVGVDMVAGEGVDVVVDLEEALPIQFLGSFVHVDCISVLEHSRRPWLLAANIERALAFGGTLFLTVPLVWRLHAYPSDYWRFTAEGVRVLFKNIDWARLEHAHLRLGPADEKIPSEVVGGWSYFAKAEVYGFGVRR